MKSNSKHRVLPALFAVVVAVLCYYNRSVDNIDLKKAPGDNITAVYAAQFFLPGIIEQEVHIPEANNDPCLAAERWIPELDTLVKSPAFTQARNAIVKAAAQDDLEHTATFGKDLNGIIDYSALSHGGQTTNGRVDMHWPGAFADLHNHQDNLPPSPGDYYGLVQIAHANLVYHTRIVCLADGTLFALLVTDPVAANAFVAQFPAVTAPGYSPKFPEPVISTFYDVRDAFIFKGYSHKEADSFGMAYILDKYHMGALLLIRDGNNAFKRMTVTDDVQHGKKDYQQQQCH